ncbi:MAG: hypothetical protein MUO99_08605 [Dehalococcoidales bacterium]|nr:hypothetical protein [Dehalococcoidales bacterium]
MSRDRSRTPSVIEVMHEGKIHKAFGCPFCKPPHELPPPGQVARCGTYINIQAVQNIYFERNLVCIVCGKGGGTMVKIGDNYKHTHDCYPGKKMLQKQPKFNPLAKVIFSLPKSVQQALNKTLGLASMQVTDKEGKIVGYSFDKP